MDDPMRDKLQSQDEPDHPAPVRVRLPGFVRDEAIGLGDVVTRISAGIGIAPCGACGQRAAVMNRWMVFTR